MQRRTVDDWNLALIAMDIEARIDWSPQHGYLLIVAGDAAQRAYAALDAYDDENRPRPAPPSLPEYGSGVAGALLAAALCALFVFTGPRANGHPWFAAGSADAARMQAGEWWRAVTALTLHDDFPHILSNAVVLLIFGSSLCTVVGPGTGLWLMLLSGTAGNLLNVLLRGTPYTGIGVDGHLRRARRAGGGARRAARSGATVSPWRAWAPFRRRARTAGDARRVGAQRRHRAPVRFLAGLVLGGALATPHPGRSHGHADRIGDRGDAGRGRLLGRRAASLDRRRRPGMRRMVR